MCHTVRYGVDHPHVTVMHSNHLWQQQQQQHCYSHNIPCHLSASQGPTIRLITVTLTQYSASSMSQDLA